MEAGGPPLPPPPPPVGQEGARLLLHTATTLLADYGWYILFCLVAVYLLIQKLSKNLRGAGRPRKQMTPVERDVVVKQQEALLAARMRMQEELNAQAEKFKEKQKMLDEEKRKQKIAMWESIQEGKSYKETLRHNQEPKPEASASASTSTVVPKPKPSRKPLRGGYNPLSGEGGGTCSWRSGRRGPPSGG